MFHKVISILFLLPTCFSFKILPEKTVTLLNAADNSVLMPIVGAGTGGYSGSNSSFSFGQYPECFDGCYDAMCLQPNPVNFSLSSCGLYVNAAISIWLQIGGRRIDNSASYHNQLYVGQAVQAFLANKVNNVSRSDLFITSKVGPFLALGYNETIFQYQSIVKALGSNPDLILIHWPSCSTGGGCTSVDAESTDPPCMWNTSTYNETLCRLSTWKALLDIWKSGGTRAIGVSNYNETHLQEILDANLPLPSVNQIPFHLYASQVQANTIQFCQKNNILVNGYSPFGVPDRQSFKPPFAPTELLDPVVLQLASKYNRTPGEIILAWQNQLGIVVNPRSMNAIHMLNNLNYWDITLTTDEINQLNSRPQL